MPFSFTFLRRHRFTRLGLFVATITLVASTFAPLAGAQQVERWIGHRFYKDKGNGWGWVKKDGDKWRKATWVALMEAPNDGIVAPMRKMGRDRGIDHNNQYVLYGYMADYKAYCPTLDEMLPIFVMKRYEPLGYASPPDGLRTGPPDRGSHRRFRSAPGGVRGNIDF